MMLSPEAWQANTAKRLRRIIAACSLNIAIYLGIAAAFLVLSVSGPEYAVTTAPAAAGAFFGAVQFAGIGVRVLSLRASLRNGRRDMPASRFLSLWPLWLIGIASTILAGLLTGLTVDRNQAYALLFAGLGCVLQLQPAAVVFSSARTIRTLLSESRG